MGVCMFCELEECECLHSKPSLPLVENQYHKGSRTEKQGAESGAVNAGTIRSNILVLLRESSMTDMELLSAYEYRHGKQNPMFAGNTMRRRRLELVKMGLVKDSGGTRASSIGVDNIVWEASRS